MNNYIENIKIIIDNQAIENYKKYYFNKYPSRRVLPIKSSIPPSLNKWMIMLRPQMNQTKQQWKEFIMWLIKNENLENKNIAKCDMTFIYYFPTKHKHDADNYTPKFIKDGLTESGLLIDDNFEHVQTLSIKGGYDKENPRTEIHIDIKLIEVK